MAKRIPLLERQLLPGWSEASITRAIIHSRLFHASILVVPRCHFAGAEADMLAVTRDLRLIDLEIKISRADALADPKKDKWWYRTWGREPDRRLAWPPKVWKHYYVMPAAIWWGDKNSRLEAELPQASGILLLDDGARREKGSTKALGHSVGPTIHLARRAKPNRKAERIAPADVLDIARLAGLRMWDALLRLETER